MLPKSKTVSYTVSTPNVYEIVSDLSMSIPTGCTYQITATAWRSGSSPYTPASGIRIFADSTGTATLNECTVAVNETPVTQQLGLSTTTVVKNVGGNSLPVYVGIKYASAGSYKVTVCYSLIPGSRDN